MKSSKIGQFVPKMGLIMLFMGVVGCTSISSDLKVDIVAEAQSRSVSNAVAQGLVDASWNLNEAVRVGALLPDDAGPKCLNRIVADLGLLADSPERPSFKPRVNGPISGAAVVYIRAKQALREKAQDVSFECKALVGEIMIAAVRRADDLVPGGGIISRVLD